VKTVIKDADVDGDFLLKIDDEDEFKDVDVDGDPPAAD
jgi:hypothetical protein